MRRVDGEVGGEAHGSRVAAAGADGVRAAATPRRLRRGRGLSEALAFARQRARRRLLQVRVAAGLGRTQTLCNCGLRYAR